MYPLSPMSPKVASPMSPMSPGHVSAPYLFKKDIGDIGDMSSPPTSEIIRKGLKQRAEMTKKCVSETNKKPKRSNGLKSI